MGLKGEEEVRREREHINRLSGLRSERFHESRSKWLRSEPGIETLDRLVRDFASNRPAEPKDVESWAKLAHESCGENLQARHAYLQGLMHGRLMALKWVLGEADDLYPEV